MNKKEIIKYIGILVILFFFIFIFFIVIENKNELNIDDIKFNIDSGFYDNDIEIEINKGFDIPITTQIFYTLDGNNPTTESSKYDNKILLLHEDNDTRVYPLKVVLYNNGKYSKIIEKTYVIDNNYDSDIGLISITMDEYDMYDYYTGIFASGYVYDQSTNENKNSITGNYSMRGDEWLRNSHMTMFNNSKDLISDSNIRLGITGSSSSSYKVKSFKIESDDKFNLDFYENDEYLIYSLNNKYSTLKLRSGSQDMTTGNIRSSLASRLSKDSNFDGCASSIRTLVYLNGSFYGVFDIQDRYSQSNLAKKYYLDNTDDIEKYRASEAKDFLDANISKYFRNDLNKEENIKLLEQYVDMDNFLLYYAVQILMDNTDWPGNNYEMWKYNGDKTDNKYSDGRYRFLIYDTDCIYIDRVGFEPSYYDTFDSIMNNKQAGKNSIFKNVMKSKYYRDKFIMLVQDLLNTSFKEENILNILDEEYDKINKAYKKYYSPDMYNNFNRQIDKLRNEIIKRDDTLIPLMEKEFNLSKKHKVTVKANNGVQINFSNKMLFQNNSYTNNYYTDINLTYNYVLYPGYHFKCWLVNGKEIYDEELVIHDMDTELNIEAVVEYDNNVDLIISEIYGSGDSDWIKLTNVSNETIYIDNYYLSDNNKNLYKYMIPNTYLDPNKSIVINGNKNYYSIGDYICNFNFSNNEIIYLTHENIIDQIEVPRMSDMETYGRFGNSNTYIFYNNKYNIRKNK